MDADEQGFGERLAELVGRTVVSVSTEYECAATLTFDDGTEATFAAYWRNDGSADLGVELKAATPPTTTAENTR